MSDSPDTSAAAIVRDHAFEPRTDYVVIYKPGKRSTDYRQPITLPPNPALCAARDGNCRLAEAAHIR
jgi:hypothetical protein